MKDVIKNSLFILLLPLVFQSCSVYNGLYIRENSPMVTEYFDIKNRKFDYYYSTDLSGHIHDYGRVSRKGDSLIFLFNKWKEREKVLSLVVVESKNDSNYTKYRFHFIKPNHDTIVDFGILSLSNGAYELDSLGSVQLTPKFFSKVLRYSSFIYYSPYYVKDNIKYV